MPTPLHSESIDIPCSPYISTRFFKVKEDMKYVISINNLRVIKGKIVCELNITVDFERLINQNKEASTYKIVSKRFFDLSHAFKNPKEFLQTFFVKRSAAVQVRMDVEKLPANPPKVIQDFYNQFLTPAPLKHFNETLKLEISKRTNDPKLASENRDSFIKEIHGSYFKRIAKKLVIPLISVGSSIGILIMSSAIAAILNISSIFVIACASLVMTLSFIHGFSEYRKHQRNIGLELIILGAVNSENLDNKENKNKLVVTLSNHLAISESECSEGLEIGKDSFSSSSSYLKSFFNSRAYNSSYYIGEILAATNNLKKLKL